MTSQKMADEISRHKKNSFLTTMVYLWVASNFSTKVIGWPIIVVKRSLTTWIWRKSGNCEKLHHVHQTNMHAGLLFFRFDYTVSYLDDVIQWKHFLASLALCEGKPPVTGGSPPHKGQWQGALMFSVICAWTNGWAKQSRRRWFQTPSCSYCVMIKTRATLNAEIPSAYPIVWSLWKRWNSNKDTNGFPTSLSISKL